ncbi:MAG: hypothetical protein AB1304_10930 [Bacteroidota bacterium]
MKIDTSLTKISETVDAIKEEVVEEKSKPFTGQSMFEDSKGKSAIFLPNGGTFGLNIADGSIRLSFAQNVSTSPIFLGLDVSGKTNDGVLSLISKGNISPGAKVNGVIGVKELFRKSDIFDGWIALKAGYEGSAFKLYNPDSAFSKQITKTTFNSFVTSLSFNLKIHGNKLLAVSVGYQKSNNYSDLDDIELIDKKIITDSATNTTRTYETKTKAKVGDYKAFQQIPINLDYFWTPKNLPRIGFYHYWRNAYSIEDKKFTNGFGTGIYLLKKNHPLSSIAGVVFEVKDITKLSENYGKGFVVNIVASYNFGFTKRK